MIKSNSNNIYNVIKDAVLSNILRILKKKKNIRDSTKILCSKSAY